MPRVYLTENIVFRLSMTDRLLLEAEADAQGLSVGAYIRSLVQRALKRAMAKMERKE